MLPGHSAAPLQLARSQRDTSFLVLRANKDKMFVISSFKYHFSCVEYKMAIYIKIHQGPNRAWQLWPDNGID